MDRWKNVCMLIGTGGEVSQGSVWEEMNRLTQSQVLANIHPLPSPPPSPRIRHLGAAFILRTHLTDGQRGCDRNHQGGADPLGDCLPCMSFTLTLLVVITLVSVILVVGGGTGRCRGVAAAGRLSSSPCTTEAYCYRSRATASAIVGLRLGKLFTGVVICVSTRYLCRP